MIFEHYWTSSMGVVGKTIGKTAAFVGKKVAKKAAIHSLKHGGVVAKAALGTAVVAGAVLDAVLPQPNENKQTKTLAKNLLMINKEDGKYVLKMLVKNKDSENLSKKVKPYIDKVESLTKKSQPYIEKIYKNKNTYLKHCCDFVKVLSGVNELPNVLNIKNVYGTDVPTIADFIERINAVSSGFADQDCHTLIALHGFNLSLLDDVDKYTRVHKDEYHLEEFGLGNDEDLKIAINYLRNVIGTYEKIIRFANEYIEKLDVCNKRFESNLKKLVAKHHKNNNYLKLRKLINPLYYSVQLISDIVNIDLVIEDRINQGLLTRMKRKIV